MRRRDFVMFLTCGATGLGGAIIGNYFSRGRGFSPGEGQIFTDKGTMFTALKPSYRDDVLLAPGFSFRRLISHREAISSKDFFGSNNDFTAFIPLREANQGILWVNHEQPEHTEGQVAHSQQKMDRQRYDVGASMLHIEKKEGGWAVVKNSHYNRRIHGTTPIRLVSDRHIAGADFVMGTLANCSGGVTPWATVLTCEENYADYFSDKNRRGEVIKKSKFDWDKFDPIPPEHYGWVVEVNPLTGKAKKLTALGRFAHEAAKCAVSKDGYPVVYMGEDVNGGFLYKFVSSDKHSLEQGELFVADMSKRVWRSLDIEKQNVLKSLFLDQTEVNTYAHEAAEVVGATPLDRPEDVVINPLTGAVFVALTGNFKRGNFHGSIMKLEEAGGDHAAINFSMENFIVGGESITCPDNLAFDALGNLWVTNDINGKAWGQEPYTKFKNNGLFFIPTSGPYSGIVHQVASAPVGAEFTGPSFSPDGKELFLSVQHPGHIKRKGNPWNSNWPHGGQSKPLSSVIVLDISRVYS